MDVSCTGGVLGLVAVVRFVLVVIQWVVPIVLIMLGTIDLVKAVIAGKEDDIKKNQQVLFKRAIAAVIVFLVPLIVTTITGLIGSDSWRTCWKAAANVDIKTVIGL